MLTGGQIVKWIEWSRRDDWHRLFVGSDVRLMLGEIQRLRAALMAIRDEDERDSHPCGPAVYGHLGKMAMDALGSDT